MMLSSTAIWGVLRSEFLMQARRWVMWLPVLACAALMLVFVSGGRANYYEHFSSAAAVGTFALLFNFLTPLACGLVLADRLVRDRSLHLDELLRSLPASARPRIWGKALGAGVATLLPWLAMECLGFALLASAKHDGQILLLGLGAFCTINLPAFLVTTALSVVLPAFVWLPVYQVGFVALWFWAGLDPSRVLSISASLLSPTGGYAAAGFFTGQGGYAGVTNAILPFGILAPQPSVVSGIISIVLVVGATLAVLEIGTARLRTRFH